jgi:outer membrane protein insertion porin family
MMMGKYNHPMKKTALIPLFTFFLFVVLALSGPCYAASEGPASGGSAPGKDRLVSESLDDIQSQVDAEVDRTLTAGGVQEPSVPLEDALREEQAPVTSYEGALEGASGDIVRAIDIEGNRSIGIATILTKIKTRVGQPYRQNVISDDLKRLYNTGFFSDVRVDRKSENGGLKVIITLEEKPIVGEITFSRVRYLNKRVILSKIKTAAGKFFDKKSLGDDVTTIKEMYQKKGLTQAEVDVETSMNEATNKVRLHFIIREGFRVKVRKIAVAGNSAFTRNKLVKVMKSRSAWLFNSGYLKEEALGEDMDRIQAFYEKNGFIDAAASYKLEEYRPGQVKVLVSVEEGKRYYVGDVVFSGNAVLSSSQVQASMKDMYKGKVFSKARLADDTANIKSLYFDKGYIFARVNEATSLNTQTGQVDIKFNIDEGGIAYVNKVKVQGNTQTRDIVIRRELRLYPGDRFDGAKLRRSKERLNNLGFFEDVNFDIEDTDVPDQKDLVVDVREAKTGSFSFGGGYSTVDQLIGFVEIEQKNFDFANWPTFTGGGQRISARAEVGSTRNNAVLSFTEPYLFDYPVSGGFDLYRTQHNRTSDTGYAYDQTNTGLKLRFGKEISEYLSAGTYYRVENIDIKNLEDTVSADLKAEEGSNFVSSLGLSLTKDHRDNIISPSKGWVATVSSDVAGGPLAGDKDFYRLELNGSYYVPFKYSSVFEFSGRVGMVDAYGNSNKVPIFERYFAGGARSIRGYTERGVGPVDANTQDAIGGESIFVGTMEYTIPIIDVLKFATFYDIGNVWAKYSDLGADKLYSGFGFGLRIKTPIGPMNLDYGIPLDTEPGESSRKSGKFYFSVSRGF